MKAKLYIILLTSFALFSFSSKNKIEKFTPPGTVKIGTNIFMDETEISNISWQEYVYWNQQTYGDSSVEYLSSLPDSNVWQEPNKSHYFSHPAYRDFPVVGISWKQAKAYCKWRSERVMDHLFGTKERKPNTVIPSKLQYRLPTAQEWERIASAGYSEKTKKKLDKKHPNCANGNFKTEKQDGIQFTTAPVHEYWPNEFGVYQMWGNVSEMTQVEGISKGGSWTQIEQEITLEKDFMYEKPTNWIGFRCVCEVTF